MKIRVNAAFDTDLQARHFIPAMDVRVRQAVPEDSESIAAIHIQAWQKAYRGQLSDHFLESLSQQLPQRIEFWRAHILAPLTPKHEIWVAEVKAKVEGFAALGPARDAPARDAASEIGELYAIYIHPDCWRQGLGYALFTHATMRLAASGYSEAVLWVLESNAAARGFYERTGWTADGGAKYESIAHNVELREVRYRVVLFPNTEES
jgi:GNAT superfamily N-acetyltransferase